MDAYPAKRTIRGPPAAPLPGRSLSRATIRSLPSGRPTPNRIVIVPAGSGEPCPERSRRGTCGSRHLGHLANDLFAAPCPYGRLRCSRHQTTLLHRQEPLWPAPLTYATDCLSPKRPKSIEFYRILQKQDLGHCAGRGYCFALRVNFRIRNSWSRLVTAEEPIPIAVFSKVIPRAFLLAGG